ncbi:hypothetical protein KIH39_21760 [Telmatocola sphagniphila]|uniref:Uncharacterized protein n=1 Tax=Telmatocola sphagniphila TaxID=1123043 RepID=A0A8E6EUM2_9BACT|nr:hypothetical protein [Telmatocola sphagniphila]QVL31447.1 hypothetical protein KIH39_21760 [Telmatocola sphagniphila]
MNPPFIVHWEKRADLDLARIYNAAADKNEITRCENIANKALSRHPDSIGKYHSEGLYTHDFGLLRFCYHIDFTHRAVYILEIIQISWDEENI